MANTPSSVQLAPGQSQVLDTADAKTRFRINNSTGGSLNVRLAAAACGPNPGDYDFWIPAGKQYFSDLDEYAGEIRVYSAYGGLVTYSKDA
jgi:hypothetical protein